MPKWKLSCMKRTICAQFVEIETWKKHGSPLGENQAESMYLAATKKVCHMPVYQSGVQAFR